MSTTNEMKIRKENCTIDAKAQFYILGWAEPTGKHPIDPAVFTVPVEFGCHAEIQVSFETFPRLVDVYISDIPVSSEFITVLSDGETSKVKPIPENIRDESNTITDNLIDAPRKVVELIKYHLNEYSIAEEFLSWMSRKWTQDKKHWFPFTGEAFAHSSSESIKPLNESSIQAIENQVKEGVRPLFALRHLHRAKKEPEPRHKWIEATIAAELAIKEMLMIAEPKIEVLLLEVPSPPLSILYGRIAKEYIGQGSPFGEQIAKGVKKRNELIHRPNEVTIVLQEAIDYVSDVERAIFFFLSLLYPEDPLIKAHNLTIGEIGKLSIER